MVSSHEERMENFAQAYPGPAGPKGDTGAPLSPRKSRAIAWMFLFALVVSGINLWWTSHEVRANGQQRCMSIAEIVHIPIPVPTAGNPSRQAWAEYEAVQRRRGRQLGCDMPPPRYAPSKPGN
jgi:hypothetical protein